MEAKSLLKKDWTPTPEAFDKMLGWLHADREQAGEEYEKIRQKLLKLFKWRNCLPEEDYADITINRVTRRVFEGSEVPEEKPYLYFHGTALNVIREFWRGQQKHKHEDFDNVSPLDLARLQAQSGQAEAAFASLQGALAERSPGLVFLKVDRAWDRIRGDPRFAALVRHVGIP